MSRNTKLALIVLALVVVAVIGPFVALSADSSKPEQQTHELDSASIAAKNYMDKFVAADGTAGTSLSFENQSQALLVAAATADRTRFDVIWQRTQSLKNTDGSWVNASSGDTLLIIRAFTVAGARLGGTAYQATAKQLAAQLLGSNQLQSATIDAATIAPHTFKDVQALTGDAQWSRISADRQKVLSSELLNARLPVDAAKLNTDGPVSAEPGAQYGAAAQRATLFLKDSCDVTDRDAAKKIWLTLRLSPTDRVATSLKADGSEGNRKPAVLPTVATAAAAEVAGEHVQALRLLDQADAMAMGATDATDVAWDAIGRIIVSTDWLGPC